MRSNGVGRKDGFAIDTYFVSFHGSATTHLDALSHLIYGGKIYDGFPATRSIPGAQRRMT